MSLWLKNGAILAVVLLAVPATAHHSDFIYDHGTLIELRGTVEELHWGNPHVHILVEVDAPDGSTSTWAIEGQTPAFMGRWGWTPDTIRPGEVVSVTANPLRGENRNLALGRTLSTADGTTLTIPQAGDSDAPSDTPTIADSIEGRWLSVTSFPLLGELFRPAQAWPLTEAGRAAVAGYDDTQDNPGTDCVLEAVPFLMVVPLIHNIQVGEEVTTIRSEGNAERTVHMNVSTHEGAVESHHGHSIGRWEGDTLVVDTTHFTPHRIGNAPGGLPSSEQKRVVERFELSEGGARLRYSYELEDPEFLSAPVARTHEFVYRPDLPEVEFTECTLESARRYANWDQ